MTNEASTVDGGIPLQLHSKRAWPAATDSRCSSRDFGCRFAAHCVHL